MAGMGFVSHFVNPRDLKAMEALINDKTKIIFVESVGNPNGDMLDFVQLVHYVRNMVFYLLLTIQHQHHIYLDQSNMVLI